MGWTEDVTLYIGLMVGIIVGLWSMVLSSGKGRQYPPLTSCTLKMETAMYIAMEEL
jgi:hypothetical protein